MKKITLLFALLVSVATAQIIPPTGLTWKETKEVSKTKVNGTFVEQDILATGCMYQTFSNVTIGTNKYDYLTCYYYNNQLVKVVLGSESYASWNILKAKYIYYKDIFTEKYGKSAFYELFSYPYDEGDGFEMTALRVDKCTYMSFWYDVFDNSMMIEVKPDGAAGYIQISYENSDFKKFANQIKDNNANGL